MKKNIITYKWRILVSEVRFICGRPNRITVVVGEYYTKAEAEKALKEFNKNDIFGTYSLEKIA